MPIELAVIMGKWMHPTDLAPCPLIPTKAPDLGWDDVVVWQKFKPTIR